MTYVITEKCLGEQYAQCVDVCPADCIFPGDYHGKPFMVIDPDLCIECDACLHVCPVVAIVASEEEAPEMAVLNQELTPSFSKNPPVVPRPADDPPRGVG